MSVFEFHLNVVSADIIEKSGIRLIYPRLNELAAQQSHVGGVFPRGEGPSVKVSHAFLKADNWLGQGHGENAYVPRRKQVEIQKIL